MIPRRGSGAITRSITRAGYLNSLLSSIRLSQFWVLDDKCRHTFEAHGRDLPGLRSNIQRLVQAFQTGAYQVQSVALPPAPFALQAVTHLPCPVAARPQGELPTVDRLFICLFGFKTF